MVTDNGIHAWMASVRTSIANDPCRQLFEDQVQTHAFIFLDDYLEHILAGPKQAPIIELVKTPGRKKNMPRRTRAATTAAAKVKNTPFLSLDCDISTTDANPVNSFHKALLQVKERSVQDGTEALLSGASSTSNGLQRNAHGRPTTAQVVNVPQTYVSIESESQASTLSLQHYFRNSPGESSTHPQAPEHGTQLSIIAEGDESPERSQADTRPLSTITCVSEELPDLALQLSREAERFPANEGNLDTIPTDPQGDPSPDGEHSAPSSTHIYHLVPFDPRKALSLEARTSNYTEPLPSRVATDSTGDRERNAFTAPLPTVPMASSIPIPHTTSVPLNDSSPRAPVHKSGTGFPMLPAPSPLRKSMRVPQETSAGFVFPIPIPAPAPLGKRTSWLMKAREAKAMEGTSTLPGTSAAATSEALTRLSTAVKRKSGEMLGVLPPGADWDRDWRKPKVAKSTEADIVPSTARWIEKTSQHVIPSVQSELPTAVSPVGTAVPTEYLESHAMDIDEEIAHTSTVEEGFIDLFKRTVEGLGARAGKSMGKSLGGAAVAALAEARAAAEAKVAERNKVTSESGDTEVPRDDGLANQAPLVTHTQSNDQAPSPQATAAERRLSLSDLAPDTVQPAEPEFLTKTAVDIAIRANSCDESLSTTPPDSPPSKVNSGFVKPTGPVFNKPPPPPVFMPPASKQSSIPPGHHKEFTSDFPASQFTLPVAVPLGIPARLASPSDGLLSLVHRTSQTPLQPTIPSDAVLDNRSGIRSWAPSAQDTLYNIDSGPRHVQRVTAADDDDDDSWPLEERLAAAEPGWRPFDFSNVDKEDTWSSLPTESQEPTRSLTSDKDGDMATLSKETDIEIETNDEEAQREQEAVEISDADAGMPGLRRVEPTARSTSQTSIDSTASSSQSQVGFFGQATKLVNSMLGAGKKTKPELKSLQLAAAAAKRQQEESNRKTQRLKDMEARRQVAIAKKAEEERKIKEESEKRKREREEHTDRRPVKLAVSAKKVEDEASKKRKLASETDKKPESKKLPSRDKKDPALLPKMTVTPATKLATQKGAKHPTVALSSSTAYNATQNAPPVPARPNIPEAKPFKVVPSSLKGKAKVKPQGDDMDDKLPSTMIQSQMAARAKAQMQAAKLPTPEVPSESIELPEINSEYSDSEDEDRIRTFDPPDWAQSPELRQALQKQSTVNPDDVFGAVPPLRMEEMFRTRQSRFRARTSSANWSGTDKLTVEEIREYERRMGFQQARVS